MYDLLAFVPSRMRAARLRDMLGTVLGLSEAQIRVVIATDNDDPQSAAYGAALAPFLGAGWVHHVTGPRRTLSGWTNALAGLYAGEARAFASLGDDHVPRTQGWDRLLLEALDAMGGEGIAYGDDKHQGQRLPTAPVISAGIVEALGWMMEPSLRHMFVDDVWRDLGQAAGCLAYVPGVVIEHCHPAAGKAADDPVYAASLAGTDADREAYERWRRDRMAADVDKIRAVMAVPR